MTDLDDDIADRLAAADQRYTAGRKQVVAVLAEADAPLTIPQIIDADPSIPQSSAYRSLAVLEEVGVVSRIVTQDDFARYELAEHLTEHHHHLICSRCGSVADFSLEPAVERALDDALGAVARTAGFAVDGHRLDLLGVCRTCKTP